MLSIVEEKLHVKFKGVKVRNGDGMGRGKLGQLRILESQIETKT